MNRASTRLAVLLTVLVMSAVAFSQSTLGNMFQLGQSTVYGLPASSQTIKGALIFDLDAGAPKFNDGTAWQSFGSGSSSGGTGYFFDAGLIGYPTPYTGGIAVNEAIVSGDGGIAVVFGTYANTISEVVAIHNEMTSGFAGEGYLGFHIAGPFDRTQPKAGLYYTGTTSGGQVSGFNIHSVGPVTTSFGAIGTTSTKVQTITGSSIDSYFPSYSHVTAATRAFNSDTGALWDPGGGTNDYFTSDGTGISTPSYWKSTAAFSATPGINSARVSVTGSNEASMNGTAAGTGSAGTLTYNTATGTIFVQKDALGFAPIGQPNVVHDAQTFTTRVVSYTGGTSATPEVAERIFAPGNSLYQMYWNLTGGSSVTSPATGRAVHTMTTAAADTSRVYGTSATAGATTTLAPLTALILAPKWCQRITPGSVLTGTRIIAGLTSNVPTGGSDTLVTGGTSGAVFFYSSVGLAGVAAGNWGFCTSTGAAMTCVDTTVKPTASTMQLLCLHLSDSSKMTAFIDGAYVGSGSTNAPAASTGLAPFVSVEAVSGGAKALGTGPLMVEWQ